MRAWWMRSWPSLYVGLFAGVVGIAWLEAAPMYARLWVTLSSVCAVAWFGAYRLEAAKRHRLAKLIAKEATDRNRREHPWKELYRVTARDHRASWWLN